MPTPIFSLADAQMSSSPSADFRTAVDTTRYTRCIGVFTVASQTAAGIAIRNPVTNAVVTFGFDIVYYPVRTLQTVPCEAAYAVVYFY